jgi:hypothetical protein
VIADLPVFVEGFTSFRPPLPPDPDFVLSLALGLSPPTGFKPSGRSLGLIISFYRPCGPFSCIRNAYYLPAIDFIKH